MPACLRQVSLSCPMPASSPCGSCLRQAFCTHGRCLEIFMAGLPRVRPRPVLAMRQSVVRARWADSPAIQVGRDGPTRLAGMDADALSTTPAAPAALGALRAAAGANGPMERHCLRHFAISERLAGDRAFDRELLLCASWLHDAGLSTPSRDPYVTEGARLAARVLTPFGWPPERLQRCMDACEQHHAPRSRMAMGLEVELVRRADLVDVTKGLVNFGLDRRWLGTLFRDVSRDGFWRLVGRSLRNELRHRCRAACWSRTRRSAGTARPSRPRPGPSAGPAAAVHPARRSRAPGGHSRTGSSPSARSAPAADLLWPRMHRGVMTSSS
jgi:hypothetical protein